MLTRQQNIFLAKKTFTELVFNTAYIEGCNVTFPQTQTIIDGAVVSGISVDDIQTVLNLRDGWKFVINSVDETLTLEYFVYVCKQQLFWDGNKRTSTMVASKILIENGEGILTIGKDNAEEFNVTLNNWYLKNELQPLKDCLRKCIRTLDM